MKLKTILKGNNHKVVIYENDDSGTYLEYYFQLFNNVIQSHHNLMSFLLEKTAEWYISEQGDMAKQFFGNLQQAASSADWGIATVNFDNQDWIFPYPIPAISDDETIGLSDWMGTEIKINKYQAGVILLAFLFQRGEGPSFFKRQMLTGNPYKDWEQTNEPLVALLVKTIADENQWNDVFRILD